MLKTKFKYNPETLRYERVKISFLNVFLSAISYLSFGFLFFVGLLFLQDFLIETPKERSLKEQNLALKKYKLVLTSDLTSANERLQELRNENEVLYEKLFETKVTEKTELAEIHGQEDILIATDEGFNNWLTALKGKFTEMNRKAKNANLSFSEKLHIDKNDLANLFMLPTTSPIENLEAEKLVSGFGTRINPFHKGHYHHDGIDIAATHGTPVKATGNGTVTEVSFNNLLAGFGNYVEINHGHGIVTRFAHLEGINVRIGQKLTKGQLIGTIGSSGGSIAPHLHYEVLQDGINIDPMRYLVEGIDARFYQALLLNSKKQNQSLD